jgi:hypothetical protein
VGLTIGNPTWQNAGMTWNLVGATEPTPSHPHKTLLAFFLHRNVAQLWRKPFSSAPRPLPKLVHPPIIFIHHLSPLKSA